ncbi:proteasome activator complex subunit 1 [Pelodytes ibericus]
MVSRITTSFSTTSVKIFRVVLREEKEEVAVIALKKEVTELEIKTDCIEMALDEHISSHSELNSKVRSLENQLTFITAKMADLKRSELTEQYSLSPQADNLVSGRFPKKIAELDQFLSSPELNVSDLTTLQAELDIPMPDPEKEKEKEKKAKDEKKKDDDEEKGPPCGPVACNEQIIHLQKKIRSEIQESKENLNMVSLWLQLQIPQIEDGNNFGVAVQEKVFELMTTLRTKLDASQTQIVKYLSDRGDAVTKAAKNPHVGDYRALVRQLDEAQYSELRITALEIRNFYATLYDIITKNYSKIKRPRGDTKQLIY